MTGKELIEKVAARCAPECDPIELTGWWISVREAESGAINDLDLREIAEMIQSGRPIGGPYNTEADIEAWVKDQEELAIDESGPGADRWMDLDEDLDEFFRGARTARA